MFTWIRRDGSLQAFIHGDQRWGHPFAYSLITNLLFLHGLLPEDRDPANLP
jgi:hypothetical protein